MATTPGTYPRPAGHERDEPTAPTGHRLVDIAGIEVSFRDVVLLWIKVLLGLPVALLITAPVWIALAAILFVVLPLALVFVGALLQ